jgi:hypothetical protein
MANYASDFASSSVYFFLLLSEASTDRSVGMASFFSGLIINKN